MTAGAGPLGLDPVLLEILACPAPDHGELRPGTPDDAERLRPDLPELRAALPGDRRDPGPAALGGDGRARRRRGGDQRRFRRDACGRVITVLDEALLEDTGRLLDADRAGLLRAAATAGAQVRATWAAAVEAGVGPQGALDGLRPRALVLLARAGTEHSAARLVAALLAPTCPCPVVVTDVAPPWLGPLDVVVVSHRGYDQDPADAQMAEAVDRAVRRSAHVVLTGPADGPAPAAAAGRAMQVVPRIPGLDGLLHRDRPRGDPRHHPRARPARGRRRGAGRPSRRRGRAQRSAPRGVRRPGQGARAPARRAHPAAVGHRPGGDRPGGLRRASSSPPTPASSPTPGPLAGRRRRARARRAAGGSALPPTRSSPTRSTTRTARACRPASPSSPSGRTSPPAASAADAARRWPSADVLEIDDADLAGDTPGHDAVRAGVLGLRLDLASLYLGLATGVAGVGGDGWAGTTGRPARRRRRLTPARHTAPRPDRHHRRGGTVITGRGEGETWSCSRGRSAPTRGVAHAHRGAAR